MSKKVLILTNRDSWVGIRLKYMHCINLQKWYEDYPDDDNPVKKCVSNNGKETELLSIDLNNLAEEAGVFLIYDSIKDIDYFNRFKEQCKGCELYVLIHHTGVLQNDAFNDLGVKKFRVGSHINGDFHMLAFDILTDKNPNKMGRIIDEVFSPKT